jgi:hypothetical protein
MLAGFRLSASAFPRMNASPCPPVNSSDTLRPRDTRLSEANVVRLRRPAPTDKARFICNKGGVRLIADALLLRDRQLSWRFCAVGLRAIAHDAPSRVLARQDPKLGLQSRSNGLHRNLGVTRCGSRQRGKAVEVRLPKGVNGLGGWQVAHRLHRCGDEGFNATKVSTRPPLWCKTNGAGR